ncbi:MAG: septal ring lytic transglycosylase RlpA family protein [Rickettsiales bacterium]|jgi:rare lipoprotein A|nr:septal ring lytic transglycosylase RlpA family protein [Rickettsiales bacterium]
MKKLSALMAALALAACGNLNGMNGDFASGKDAGLAEESLNNSVGNDYAQSRTTDVAAPAAQAAQAAPNAAADALAYAGPKYYIGTPYKIEDIQYTPAEDMNYNTTGTAGIVPVDLNGVATTNGEMFDGNAMQATSKVLPLPSIVRVTNLENGQTADVRVNNRGPFVNSRLMDVSPAAAKKLGMTGQTKVQVQILAAQSQKAKDLSNGTATTAAPATTTSDSVSAPATTTGPYTVQVGAYYSSESANSIANRISSIGSAVIVEESGMYKIRIQNLSATDAKRAIGRLRDEENMAPGLLKDGRWVNADSI